jgi:hypothetical protein
MVCYGIFCLLFLHLMNISLKITLAAVIYDRFFGKPICKFFKFQMKV